MHAIPTTYGGVNFRSRLEARWAAFFDLLDWSWDYEPIDLAGYIPDFVIKPPYVSRCLVEVKPEATLGVLDRVFDSGWSETAVVVGAIPNFRARDDHGERAVSVGLGSWPGSGWEMCDALLVYDDGGFEFAPPCVNSTGEPHLNTLQEYWREAGNRVQWKRPA